ncbi:hypothetical protein ACWT_3638 [Actinoplanes sp. SE50]|nr:hypothetical protein ACPL_3766 [Actinoplanes sp. SE50/110]ATO83053.1 hypothetical protein ACWT_3638 [Actinoplanes sp. SE50]SLM00461.1 hypothetical protein ACSP50_3693 [Actinoplanes sp. SE50/110]
MLAALVAAGGWGFSDFLAGVLARRIPVLTVLIGSQIAAMLVVLPAAAVHERPAAWDGRLWLGVAAGLVGLPAMGLLYRAMRDGSPAVVAPVATVAAMVPVGWGLRHGPGVGTVTWLGVVAGLAGATLASWPAPGGDPALGRRPAMLCALGAAAAFGVYFVLLHEAGAADPFWALAGARVSGGAGALLLALGLRERHTVRFRSPILLVGLADVVADGAFLVAAAAALAPAAVVTSLYPAVTLLLNRWFLRERLHAVQLYGVVAALFSVACLAR